MNPYQPPYPPQQQQQYPPPHQKQQTPPMQHQYPGNGNMMQMNKPHYTGNGNMIPMNQMPGQHSQSFSAASSSYYAASSSSSYTGSVQQQQQQQFQQQQHFQQQQQHFQQQQHQYQPQQVQQPQYPSGYDQHQQQQQMPPGSTMIMSQVYQMNKREQYMNAYPSSSTPPGQQMVHYQQPAYQQQSFTPPPPQPQPNYHQQPVQPPQPVYQQQPEPYQYVQPEPIITEPDDDPSPSTATHILTHTDGSMLIQEVFLSQNSLSQNMEKSFLDMQGIWYKQQSELKLSLRLQNQHYSFSIENLTMTFEKNSFGLTVAQPNLLQQPLKSGEMKPKDVFLYCSSENQQVKTEASLLTLLTIKIEFKMNGKMFNFKIQTHVPLHLFFQDHPQLPHLMSSKQEDYEMVLNQLSSSEEGPRLTSTQFLDDWKQLNILSQFTVENIPWRSWLQKQQQQATIEKLMLVIQHKLAINRLYTVASRTASGSQTNLNQQQQPELVYFVSLKVGNIFDQNAGTGNGYLILCELRFCSDGEAVWEQAKVSMKGRVNELLVPALERAIRAILLSG